MNFVTRGVLTEQVGWLGEQEKRPIPLWIRRGGRFPWSIDQQRKPLRSYSGTSYLTKSQCMKNFSALRLL